MHNLISLELARKLDFPLKLDGRSISLANKQKL
jgi:hypothetical protein